MIRFLQWRGDTVKTTMERLRELRDDNDLTQNGIASVLGISQQHYSKYETGEYEIPLRHFTKLAEYYGVSADYLIGRCDLHEKRQLEMVYVTRDCTCEQLLADTLSLTARDRQAVVDYVKLQKMKEDVKR